MYLLRNCSPYILHVHSILCMYSVHVPVRAVIDSQYTHYVLGQGEEHHPLKCCRCNSILGNVTVEDSSPDVLDISDAFSIHLYKHSISLRSSNLFRYGLSYAMY